MTKQKKMWLENLIEPQKKIHGSNKWHFEEKKKKVNQSTRNYDFFAACIINEYDERFYMQRFLLVDIFGLCLP